VLSAEREREREREQKSRLTRTWRHNAQVGADVVESVRVGSRANVVSSVPFSGVVDNESTRIRAVVPLHAAVGASHNCVLLVTNSHCAVTGRACRVDSPQPLNNQHTCIARNHHRHFDVWKQRSQLSPNLSNNIKSREHWCGFRFLRTHRQTNRHTHHNTWHPSQ